MEIRLVLHETIVCSFGFGYVWISVIEWHGIRFGYFNDGTEKKFCSISFRPN